MKFTKEEKKELDASFKRVLEDIKELYDVSDMETYKKRIIFYNMNTYRLGRITCKEKASITLFIPEYP